MENSNIHNDFLIACRKGNLNAIIKFKMLSLEIINQGLKEACSYQHIEVMRHLLNYMDADIHFEHDKIFEIACFNKFLDVLEFLIVDRQIKKTSQINSIMVNVEITNDLTFDIVNSIFNKRK